MLHAFLFKKSKQKFDQLIAIIFSWSRHGFGVGQLGEKYLECSAINDAMMVVPMLDDKRRPTTLSHLELGLPMPELANLKRNPIRQTCI